MYLDLLRKLLAHTDGKVVDLQGHHFSVGHCLVASVVILHGDQKWSKRRILGAEPGHLVNAGSPEIILLPIKGCIVRVSGSYAGPVTDSMASPDTIDHAAFCLALARRLLAFSLA